MVNDNSNRESKLGNVHAHGSHQAYRRRRGIFAQIDFDNSSWEAKNCFFVLSLSLFFS